MKPWPKNNDPVNYEELVNPLIAAMRHGYRLVRKNKNKDCPWNGFEEGRLSAATVPNPDEMLSVEGQKYESERGRNYLATVIGVAVRVGIEQGRRMMQREIEQHKANADHYRLMLDKVLEEHNKK